MPVQASCWSRQYTRLLITKVNPIPAPWHLPQQDGVSVQASCWSRQSRSATHTALLHLKPLPKASCHTRSPRRTPCTVST